MPTPILDPTKCCSSCTENTQGQNKPALVRGRKREAHARSVPGLILSDLSADSVCNAFLAMQFPVLS